MTYNSIVRVKQSLMTSDVGFLICVDVDCNSYINAKNYHHIKMRHKKRVNPMIIFAIVMVIVAEFSSRK